MLDSSLIVFILTSLLIILSPGQDMVLVLSRSISRGPQAGVVTAAGVATGLLGHTLLAALGLGALLHASEFAYSLMKYIGAAYLLYLGVKAFRAPPIRLHGTDKLEGSLGNLFMQGAFSNISNPKIAIFYLAYLPQFVSIDGQNSTHILLILGITFALLTFIVKAPIGILAGVFSGWIQSRPLVQCWINRCCGTVLVAMGLRLAVFDSLNS